VTKANGLRVNSRNATNAAVGFLMQPQFDGGTFCGRAMLSDLEQRLVYREMEMLPDDDLVRWARAAIRQSDAMATDPDIVELASLQLGSQRRGDALALLRRAVARANPSFDMKESEAQAFGRAAFVQVCRRYLAEDLPPHDVCRLIGPIEQTFDYPAWLGDFYNQCDWCDPGSTRSDFEHLAAYVTQFLAENADVSA
jgi:hypothetical protein